MAKYLISIFILILTSCEINSQQIIKPEKFNFKEIKFNAVSKTLTYEKIQNDLSIDNMKKIVQFWYDNKIKINGLDGSLDVIIQEINFTEVKEIDYYKFTSDILIHFDVKNESLNRIKTYKIKASDFGEIKGSFSIKDQENLSLNIMHKSLESINNKILDIN